MGSGTPERIAVVDVLHAFALFGIIVTHAEMAFLAGRPPSPDFITFGCFLLGVCAGRMNLFRDSADHRRFFRRLLVGAGSVAAVMSVIVWKYPALPGPATLKGVLASFAGNFQAATLAAFHTAAVTLLFWKKPTEGLLPQLALGKVGAAACVALAYVLQAATEWAKRGQRDLILLLSRRCDA